MYRNNVNIFKLATTKEYMVNRNKLITLKNFVSGKL